MLQLLETTPLEVIDLVRQFAGLFEQPRHDLKRLIALREAAVEIRNEAQKSFRLCAFAALRETLRGVRPDRAV